jgi:hypothetical protein
MKSFNNVLFRFYRSFYQEKNTNLFRVQDCKNYLWCTNTRGTKNELKYFFVKMRHSEFTVHSNLDRGSGS